MDETLSRNEISKAQMAQTDQMCFLISDKNNSGIVDGLNMFGTDVQQMLDNGKLFKADTLEELGRDHRDRSGDTRANRRLLQ